MEKIKKWSQEVILARERYLIKAIKRGQVFNDLQWPLFDIGDDVTNNDFSRNGRIIEVSCRDPLVSVNIVDGGGWDLSMEPLWDYVVKWKDGEIECTHGLLLRED